MMLQYNQAPGRSEASVGSQQYGEHCVQERKVEADRLQMVRTMQDNKERLAARQLARERDKNESDRYDATHCTLRAERHVLA